MSAGTQIIIGIDFGTTYSGVSWALSTGNKEVRIINDWPNPQGMVANQDKVPSAISYDTTGKVSKWGYKVNVSDDSFRWFKILLDPLHKYFRETQHVQEVAARIDSLGKSPEDIAADYLKCIWDYTVEHLKRKKGDDFREVYTVKVVLTVPAVWSDMAKDRTLRAATRAGIPVGSKLVTEPEAAALAILKQKSEENGVKVGDGIVVCDAGGGTVDLISYKVESLFPLKVRECVIGDGGLCGSVFLDLAFEQHIRTLVGRKEYEKIKAKDKKKMLRDFEFGIKRAFSKDDVVNYSVDLRGVEDNPDHGIEDDTIQIRPNALRAIFDSICLRIQDLVDKQLIGIQKKGIPTRAVALVGGFGESKYLYDYLKTANSRSGVNVLQEPGAISAVCRGATLWGLEQSNVTSFLARMARISYGIVFSQPWDPTNSNMREADRWYDSAKGRWLAAGQMTWLLKRGEEVVEGRVLKGETMRSLNIKPGDYGNWSVREDLYYCDADLAPGRKDDMRVKKLCSLVYSIPYDTLRGESTYMMDGKEWRDIYYSRDILCGGANLEFRILYKGKLIQSVEAEYVDSSH